MVFSKRARFRAAEKLIAFGVDSSFPDRAGDPLLIHNGFAPLLIHRPICHFQRTIGLEPGARSVPSWDFLVGVLGYHRSHDAVLRDGLGESLYKALCHLRSGRHTLTRTTVKNLARKLGVSVGDLKVLARHPDRIVLANIRSMYAWLELMPSAYRLLWKRPRPVLALRDARDAEADAWWATKCSGGLGRAESIFLDRLLLMSVGMLLVGMVISDKPTAFWFLQSSPAAVAYPAHHPIGNWLAKAAMHAGFRDLKHWYQRQTAEVEITHEKMRKWSAGERRMPMEQGMLLIGVMGIKDHDERFARMAELGIAHLVHLSQEFLMAAHPIRLERDHARELVHERLSEFESEALDGALHVPKRLIRASLFPEEREAVAWKT